MQQFEQERLPSTIDAVNQQHNHDDDDNDDDPEAGEKNNTRQEQELSASTINAAHHPPHEQIIHHQLHHIHQHDGGGGEDQNLQSIDQRAGPPWLDPFLEADYFSRCRAHGAERNRFCIDCGCNGCLICPTSFKLDHSGHHTLQVRKASHFDAIRCADIEGLIDIAGIQTYTINKSSIVFLRKRPHSKDPHKDSATFCLFCDRNLHHGMQYCSIGCKLASVRQRLDGGCSSLWVSSTGSPCNWDGVDGHPAYMSASKVASCNDQLLHEQVLKSQRTENCMGFAQQRASSMEGKPPQRPRKTLHRRKGIPHRSPLQ